jgi:hypothetical protein
VIPQAGEQAQLKGVIMFVRSTSRTSCRFSAWAVITAVMAFVAAAAALTAPSAAAAANSDRLNPNEQLNNGARLISPNGQSRRVRARQPADLGDGNKHPRLGRANAGRRQSCDNRAGQHSRLGQRDERLPQRHCGASKRCQHRRLLSWPHRRWASGSNGGNPALTERIAAIARNEAANPNHNHENGANCNFYSGALGSGTPCAGGWRAQAWCADFARWVYGQAGAATGGLDGRAASFYTYGRAHGTWKPGYNAANARVGGAVVYNLDTRGPNASHVGIVVAVNGNRTIEIISGKNSRNQVGSTGVFTPSASSGISGYVSPTHRRTSSAWLPPSRRGRCAPNSGRFTTMSASARAYSANAPWQKPSTSSPGRTVVGRSGLGPVPAGAGMPAPGSRAGRDESRCRVRGFASTTRRPTAAGGK